MSRATQPTRDGAAARPVSRVEEALRRLREEGERVTPGRRAVLETLDAAYGHLDAEAICAAVTETTPGVHRATVYRSLQALTDLGVLTHTHVPGGATIYHLTPQARQPHAHLQCTHCHRFFDLPIDDLEPLRQSVRRTTGFEIDPCHAALLGTCVDCASSDDD